MEEIDKVLPETEERTLLALNPCYHEGIETALQIQVEKTCTTLAKKST